MITVYGIRQCDTCRKALKWLEQENVTHQFHDLRADGLDAARLSTWLGSDYADRLVNRRSTTWRSLHDEQKQAQDDDLLTLLLEHPTLLKRPLFETGGRLVAVGFSPDTLRDALA